MRAYDMTIWLLVVNASLWVLDALGIWTGPGAPAGGLIMYVSEALIFSFVGAVSAAGVVYLYGSRLTTPDLVAIGSFAMVFWALFGISVGILSSLYVPVPLLMVWGVIHGIAFYTALVQMVNKTSVEVMA